MKIILLIAMITLSGCSTWRKLNGNEKGAVIGGGSGVLIGNMVAPGIGGAAVGGAAVGGAAGALGGGILGNEIDKDNR